MGHLRAKLLEAGLLGDASSPLSLAMESAGFGRPSALNHVETSSRQMTFHAGMEGLKKSQLSKAKKRIWAALEKTAIDGVPYSTYKRVCATCASSNVKSPAAACLTVCICY